MTTKRIVILPKLYSWGDDAAKNWFVYYSYRDPNVDKMKGFRVYKGFAKYKTAEEKNKHGKKLIKEIKKKLKNGWTPFVNADVIYQDSIQYQRDDNKGKRGKGLNYYTNKYLESLIGIRPATYTSYKSKFRCFEKFIKETTDLKNSIHDLEKKHADQFQKHLARKRNLKNKTINEYNVLLKTFFKKLINDGVVKQSPFAHLKKRDEETIKPRIYSKEILTKIITEAKQSDRQLYLVLQIIYSCFIRPGELRYIQIKDIDFSTGFIRIRADVSKVKKQRMSVVPDYVMAQIRDLYMDKYDDELYLISSKGEPGKTPVSRNYLYTRFVNLKKRAGIPKGYIMYAFKHTGMVDLKRAGADWLAIRNQAGHKSLDQTIEYTTELMGDNNTFIREKSPFL
jgi:site-specific recombinase XerD